jgi:hypothetical protein
VSALEWPVSALSARLARRLEGWPSLADRMLAGRLGERGERVRSGPRALAGEVASRFETGVRGSVARGLLPLAPIVVAARRAERAPRPEPAAADRPAASASPAGTPAETAAPPVATAAPAAPPASPALGPTPPPSLERAVTGPSAAPLPLAPAAAAAAEEPAAAPAPPEPGPPTATAPGLAAAPPAGPAPAAPSAPLAAPAAPGPAAEPAPVVGPEAVTAAPARSPLPLPPSGLATAILQRARLTTAGSALAVRAARREQWSPALRRGGPDGPAGRRLAGVVLTLPFVGSAGRVGVAPAPAGHSAAVVELPVVAASPAPARQDRRRLALLPPLLPVASTGAAAPAPATRAAAPAPVLGPAPASRGREPAAPGPTSAPALVLAAPAARSIAEPGLEAAVALAPLELPTLETRDRAPGADPRRLADQVYELLVRRLGRERARRGW